MSKRIEYSDTEYRKQKRRLEKARLGSGAMRRVLANVATYMIFDDHEITDDWNLNENWRQTVGRSQSGPTILTNGLAAYWAFQAWGSNPNCFDRTFRQTIESYLAKAAPTKDQIRNCNNMLTKCKSWSFSTPTSPPVTFVDTRTQRGPCRVSHRQHNAKMHSLLALSLDLKHGPARLLNRQALSDLKKRLRTLVPCNNSLILVTPSPVFGSPLIESLQRNVSMLLGPTKYDFESWSANPQNITDILGLIRSLRHEVTVILSGDVHHALTAMAELTEPASNSTSPGQWMFNFTSSATKNVSFGNSLLAQHRNEGPFVTWWWTPRNETSPVCSHDATSQNMLGSARSESRWLGQPDHIVATSYFVQRNPSQILVARNNVGLLTICPDKRGRNELYGIKNNWIELIGEQRWNPHPRQ